MPLNSEISARCFRSLSRSTARSKIWRPSLSTTRSIPSLSCLLGSRSSLTAGFRSKLHRCVYLTKHIKSGSQRKESIKKVKTRMGVGQQELSKTEQKFFTNLYEEVKRMPCEPAKPTSYEFPRRIGRKQVMSPSKILSKSPPVEKRQRVGNEIPKFPSP